MDWSAVLLDPIYNSSISTTATVTLTDTASTTKTLTVIDKTNGIELDGVETIKPAAVVRVKEMTDLSLTRAAFDGAGISFNGSSWTIEATAPKPTPGGESDGELYLLLKAS